MSTMYHYAALTQLYLVHNSKVMSMLSAPSATSKLHRISMQYNMRQWDASEPNDQRAAWQRYFHFCTK